MKEVFFRGETDHLLLLIKMMYEEDLMQRRNRRFLLFELNFNRENVLFIAFLRKSNFHSKFFYYPELNDKQSLIGHEDHCLIMLAELRFH